MLGELGGLAEVAADEGGVEAAARGGGEGGRGGAGGRRGVRGGRRGLRVAVRGGRRGVRGGRRGVRGAVCGGLRGGGLRGGVHGGALLYAGSGRGALVRGRAAVFAGDVFFETSFGRAGARGGGPTASSANRSGFGDFAGGGI